MPQFLRRSALLLGCFAAISFAADPVSVIFDTDIGNDVDDVLALSALHAFESRGQAKILAVTITKDNAWAPVFIDMLDTFYGRPDIPIGIVKHGKTTDPGNYLRQTLDLKNTDGSPRYAHRLTPDTQVDDAVPLLRKTLAGQPDGSVVIVQVGFSTNLARLLDSKGDAASPLSGRDLAAHKVRLLSIMGGDYRTETHQPEYNITNDIPAAQKLFRDWPGPIVASGFDIGESITYPSARLDSDFRYIDHHPLVDAYRAYKPVSYDEPLWDPSAALYAVKPDAVYFTTSAPGKITVEDSGVTRFAEVDGGKQRYLIVNPAQRARVAEAIALLISEPPSSACCSHR